MKRYVTVVLIASLTGFFATAARAEDRVRIVSEGGIRDEWMLADGIKLAAPSYPVTFAERGDNVCVAIGYAIKPDGSTSDFAVLKNWSSGSGESKPGKGFWQAFAQAGAEALSQWKFKPRMDIISPRQTYTVATMHFMGKEPTDVAALRSHCAISDLATAIQDAKSRRFQRGTILKSEMERLRRTNESDASMVENPLGNLNPPQYDGADME